MADAQALSQDVLDLCADASNLVWRHVDILAENVPNDELHAPLCRWAVVLGVLSADVFESVVSLLNECKIRGGNMLSRALVDYDIRLRYYIIQTKKWRRKYEKRKHVRLEDVRAKMHAARDWDNATFKLGSILSHYDPSLWTPEIRAEIARIMALDETEQNLTFVDMLEFLQKYEGKLRGVIPLLQHQVLGRYDNMRAMWRMQSSFLHGDQGILSDVYEFRNNEAPVMSFKRGPVGPNLLLFTALHHVIELLTSFEMIDEGLFGKAALHDRATILWHRFREKD